MLAQCSCSQDGALYAVRRSDNSGSLAEFSLQCVTTQRVTTSQKMKLEMLPSTCGKTQKQKPPQAPLLAAALINGRCRDRTCDFYRVKVTVEEPQNFFQNPHYQALFGVWLPQRFVKYSGLSRHVNGGSTRFSEGDGRCSLQVLGARRSLSGGGRTRPTRPGEVFETGTWRGSRAHGTSTGGTRAARALEDSDQALVVDDLEVRSWPPRFGSRSSLSARLHACGSCCGRWCMEASACIRSRWACCMSRGRCGGSSGELWQVRRNDHGHTAA